MLVSLKTKLKTRKEQQYFSRNGNGNESVVSYQLPASQIGEACSEPCAENCVSSCCSRHWPHSIGKLVCVVNLCLQDDGNNHPINCHSFAEDNAARKMPSLSMECQGRFHLQGDGSKKIASCGKGALPDLMRFLDVILGTLIAAPRRLLPVAKIPLHIKCCSGC